MAENQREVWVFQDHYAVLEVAPTATREEITRAFWKKSPSLKKKAEWDKAGQKDFVAVIEAYQTLSDGDRRRTYDHLHSLPAPEKERVLSIAQRNEYTWESIRLYNLGEAGKALESLRMTLGEARRLAGDDTNESIEERLKAIQDIKNDFEKPDVPADERENSQKIYYSLERFYTHLQECVTFRDGLEADAAALRQNIDTSQRKPKEMLLEDAVRSYTVMEQEKNKDKHIIRAAALTVIGIAGSCAALLYGIFTEPDSYPQFLQDYCAPDTGYAKHACEITTTMNASFVLPTLGISYLILSSLYYKMKEIRENKK